MCHVIAVRQGVTETPSSEDEFVLDALADTMIQTTENLIKKMDEREKRLDETHALLEAQ